MPDIITVNELEKTYASGHQALKSVSLNIQDGEILALLGPNGAGKTTLISAICGLVNPTGGSVTVGGFDIIKDYRQTRQMIGLVPQELTLGAFETVWDTINLSRGLFGKKPDSNYLDQLLKDLSLHDKKFSQIRALSGGMKRRVLIAKALSHQPKILFLDEPTAGVDVELRKDMWQIVSKLRESGVTTILTTHYIEEAEEIADRIGVIRDGELLLIEEKKTLIQKMGKKQLAIELRQSITEIPEALSEYELELISEGSELLYTYDTKADQTGITRLITSTGEAGLTVKDIRTTQSSLEDIFVDLVHNDKPQENPS
uniref:ABC-type multidrug transport system, ATPase component n=1 Tax=uncultured Thiotrichaceae bacterium TaxID=298394 RepID=A0A6S6UN52_9GAMM|nr:MAG: ABC-type multidrug transport system, ATPase component [uncultured Thiotrichaceae bacterium]